LYDSLDQYWFLWDNNRNDEGTQDLGLVSLDPPEDEDFFDMAARIVLGDMANSNERPSLGSELQSLFRRPWFTRV